MIAQAVAKNRQTGGENRHDEQGIAAHLFMYRTFVPISNYY